MYNHTKETISTVHYRPNEYKAVQMARHAEVETDDSKRKEEDFRDNIYLGPTNAHLDERLRISA